MSEHDPNCHHKFVDSPNCLKCGWTPPPADKMLQFFAYEHLPPSLGAVSKPFGDLARQIVATLPQNHERTVALRKLMEAKDCAVRAFLYKD